MYAYAGAAAINAAYFYRQGYKDTKNDESKVWYTLLTVPIIDMIPMLWNDSETLTQKLGITNGISEKVALASYGSSILSQFFFTYHNIELNHHDKNESRKEKIKQGSLYNESYLFDKPKDFGKEHKDLAKEHFNLTELVKDNQITYNKKLHEKAHIKYIENQIFNGKKIIKELSTYIF